MRLSTILGGSLLAVSVPWLALADAHAHAPARRHHEIANRPRGDLAKRFSNARFTFYDITTGTTACGKNFGPEAFVVALNSAQFGGGYPGPNCFKSITISFGGKSTQATIQDECPGCPYGGLDLTEGLFKFFAPESVGVLMGEWTFGDGGGDDTPTTTAKPDPPKTTSTHVDPPKTTSSPPPAPTTTHTTSTTPTTTSHSSTTSTTSSSATTSSAKSSSSAPSSSSASSSAAATPSVNVNSGPAAGLAEEKGTIVSTPENPQNINTINEVLINLGGLLVTGST